MYAKRARSWSMRVVAGSFEEEEGFRRRVRSRIFLRSWERDKDVEAGWGFGGFWRRFLRLLLGVGIWERREGWIVDDILGGRGDVVMLKFLCDGCWWVRGIR